MMAPITERRVVIVAFDGVQAVDVTGPAEVFSLANRFRPGSYLVEVLAPAAGSFATSSGIRMAAESALADCVGPFDTVIVAGGLGVSAAADDADLVGWLREAPARARRVASVCTGAFLLAEAGLLDRRSATTHWASCAELAKRYPAVHVDSEPIFVRDGDVYTSAGITAGMDLSLALVEEDLGPVVAGDTARWLVLFLKRPGGQSQFSALLSSQVAEVDSLRALQEWMVDHLDEDLSVPRLAARVCMSPRNFARAFRREVGVTPANYVEQLRVERARTILHTTTFPLETVARQSGFRSVETMRRAFHRQLKVGLGEYRARFSTARGWLSAA